MALLYDGDVSETAAIVASVGTAFTFVVSKANGMQVSIYRERT